MIKSPYQFRAFIGPAYEPADSIYHYSWPEIVSLGLDLAAANTTLSAQLADSATSMTLASAANMRTAGGVWVAPTTTGQAWEYISYSGKSGSQLTGLRREPATVREHNGVHGVGAVVRQWWEITSDAGRIQLTEQLDSQLTTVSWRAELTGGLAPQAALRNNHLIVVQTRTSATGSWSNWLIGFIANPKIRDDYSRTRTWTIQIVSLAAVVSGYVAKSVRVGDLDLARAGDTSTDTVLALASKEFLSGEFTASEPDFSGDSAIDDDPDTLWFAERLRGTPPPLGYPGSGPLHEGRFVCSARLRRWPGEPKGYRWLEFLASEISYPNTLNNGWLCCKWGPAAQWIEFNGLETSPNDLIIFCENLAKFQEANPLAAPLAMFEISSGFFDSLDPAGDAIAVFIGGWFPTFAYGTGGRPRKPDNDAGSEWSTNTIPAPGVGQIIRYSYNAAAALDNDHFLVDYIDYAGHRSLGEDPWLQVKLPFLGLSLRDNITASSPGAGQVLYLMRGDGPSPEGLVASGTIQIGMEQISYAGRVPGAGVTLTARGVNGTTAANHAAGDLVRVVDGGVATQGLLINRIEWERPHSPYPESFKIRVSSLDSARVPPDDNHGDDYTIVAQETGWAAETYMLNLSPSLRATNVIIEIDHNNTYPSRPRLNAFRVIADPAAYDSSTAVAAGDAVNVIERVLLNAGLPAAAIAKTLGSVTLDKIETSEGESAWSVAADLAARCNVAIDATRTGTLAIYPNTLPAGVLSPAVNYTDVSVAALEFVQTAAAAVAQVRQPYRLSDGTTDTARYPDVAVHPAGQLVDLPETRFASAATALDVAQRSYILQRYPVTMVVQCADAQPTIRPGTVVNLQWQLASDMQPIDRLGIVVGADHEIADGMWTTVLTVMQIDREWSG
jgi:hypothetical protein